MDAFSPPISVLSVILTDSSTGSPAVVVASVRAEPDHVLGTCPLHRRAHQVHDELLLGQEHLLPAVEQAHSQIRRRLPADGALLPVDTFHSPRTGAYL